MSQARNIFIAGHNGMVGAAIARILQSSPDNNIITRSKNELDLTNQSDVSDFFLSQSVDEIYLAAAKVGGIHANNTYPADFIYENLMIEANIIHAAHKSNIQKLLFLGSSCIYPRDAPQPMTEESLLVGKLEATNEPYAIAKIAGIKLCESYNRQYGRDYRSAMPTNLYGPNDNFHEENSHVIPALLRRFHQAKLDSEETVTVWGSGRPRREFLYVDDLAAACVFLMGLPKARLDAVAKPMESHINIGVGEDVSIAELANLIKNTVGYSGTITFDSEKPDGTPRKLLSVDRIHSLGWTHKTDLVDGLQKAYGWFIENQASFRSS